MSSNSSRSWWRTIIVAAIAFIFVVGLVQFRGPEEVTAYPANRVLRSAVLDGIIYKLAEHWRQGYHWHNAKSSRRNNRC